MSFWGICSSRRFIVCGAICNQEAQACRLTQSGLTLTLVLPSLLPVSCRMLVPVPGMATLRSQSNRNAVTPLKLPFTRR